MYNLSDFFNQEGKTDTIYLDGNIESCTENGISYSVKSKTPLALEIRNLEKEKIQIKGTASYLFEIPCDRCLESVETKIDLLFEQELYGPNRIEEAENAEELKEEQVFLTDFELDESSLIKEQLFLHWPQKILCREDCKGICPKCGTNLNQKQCDCDTFVPDPRWAGLEAFMNSQ